MTTCVNAGFGGDAEEGTLSEIFDVYAVEGPFAFVVRFEFQQGID